MKKREEHRVTPSFEVWVPKVVPLLKVGEYISLNEA
jgi:hypothetical protein